MLDRQRTAAARDAEPEDTADGRSSFGAAVRMTGARLDLHAMLLVLGVDDAFSYAEEQARSGSRFECPRRLGKPVRKGEGRKRRRWNWQVAGKQTRSQLGNFPVAKDLKSVAKFGVGGLIGQSGAPMAQSATPGTHTGMAQRSVILSHDSVRVHQYVGIHVRLELFT